MRCGEGRCPVDDRASFVLTLAQRSYLQWKCEVSELTSDILATYVAALSAQGAVVVDHLQPGLTDREIDATIAPHGIAIPEEARVWWRFSNGVPEAELGRIGPEWFWSSLEEVIEERNDMLANLRENLEPDEILWRDTWLPFVMSERLPLETASAILAPVFSFDVHTGDPALPVAASLADLVMTWVRALESGALRYERATGLFAVDFELAAILGLPDGIV